MPLSGNLELQQLFELTLSTPAIEGTVLSREEILDKLLAHDRWKTEARFAHELALEELKLSRSSNDRRVNRASKTPHEISVSEEDSLFNQMTSYDACTDKQIGSIAKTKVWDGASDRAKDLADRWYSHLQENNILPLKDLKEGRIKTLLLLFMWASGCAHRAHKWPEAPDSSFIPAIKKELKERLSKFSQSSIVAAYESLKVFWKEINDYENYPFNSTFISEILDEAYAYLSNKQEEEKSTDIKFSPFFQGFEEVFPEVPLKTLEKYYFSTRGNLIATGISALRRVFTTNRPEELKEKYSESDWPRKWHLHIETYEPIWKEKIKEIIEQTKQEQELWNERKE
jgi:hypothetical protein